ncbi:MAG: DUF748 domain-containing protein [Bacteroidia bacterium]|nr:DUF748 domain-containing protein [Bacteroidia bacterium]
MQYTTAEDKKESTPVTRKKRGFRSPLFKAFVVIFLVLIAFRLILPYIVLNYVNKKLANLKEYYGHVNDIDIALFRGAYVIKGTELVKIGNDLGDKDTVPFFRTPAIDLSVQWAALFKGKIVGEIYVEDPVLNFVKGKHKNEDAKADTADFSQLIKDLMPLTVNHFEITNGEIHYIDHFSNPSLDLAIKELNISADNLTNVNDSSKLLPARAVANGKAYGGEFKMKIDFDALQKQPTFDMSAEITQVNLVELNDFLKAYGNFDVNKGSFGMYTEFAGRNGEFGGYVKPIIKDIDVVQWNKEEGDFAQILWESVVGGAAEILKNRNREQVATKVNIKGRFDDPSINLWRTISFLLRNAFVHALVPAIDNSINIHKMEDVKDKTLLERLFGGDDKKKKKS